MSNSFFQFKQFTIHLDHCAMKVCTDACIFGAIVASDSPYYIHHPDPNHRHRGINLLDIGTGTGLLSLMYAQNDPYARIDAIEIDERAAMQAKENFNASPWKKNLHIFNEDILHFNPKRKYDLIISNPPFFEGDLRSTDENKNNAKHDSSLSLQQLLEVIDRHLSPGCCFGVLLPYHRVAYFEKLAAEFNFYCTQKILIRQTPKHDPFRGILFFSKNKTELRSTGMLIKESDGNYSNEFVELLKDYYLNL